MVVEHAWKTPNNVCNQLCHGRRSNPIVKLITPERLGVPKVVGVVNLVASISNGHDLIDLSSSNVDAFLSLIRMKGS